MVKDITPKKDEVCNVQIGFMRIEAVKLIEILKKHVIEENITATNEVDEKIYEFSGIEDLEKNIDIFTGKPVIHIGNIELKFNGIHTCVKAGVNSPPDIRARVKSLSAALEKERSLVNKLYGGHHSDDYGLLAAFGMNLLSTILIGYFTGFHFNAVGNSALHTILMAIFFFGGVLVFASLLRARANNLNQVIHTPNLPFFKRNFDKIILMIIAAGLGVIITKLFG